MNDAVTFGEIVRIAVIIMGCWGFVKVVMEIVKAITARHDREQKWDDMAEKINSSRESIIMKYDSKLAEMEKTINDNHSDTESKLQQIRSEQCIITSCTYAILDGLEQLGANHRVSEQKALLQEYMNGQAHAR